MKKSLEERVAMGECVSPFTTDRCPYCTDTCEASDARRIMAEAKRQIKVCKVHIAKEEGDILLMKEKGSDREGYVDIKTNNN